MTTLAATPEVSAQTTAILPIPVGFVGTYCSAVAPNGWLLCDGQAINPNTYPALCALVGPNVPDLRSRFLVGAGQGAGLSNYPLKSSGGAENVTLSVNQIPSHQHFGFGEAYDNWPLGLQGKNQMGSKGGADNDNYYYGTTSTGGGQAHENRPPYYALTYIIKY